MAHIRSLHTVSELAGIRATLLPEPIPAALSLTAQVTPFAVYNAGLRGQRYLRNGCIEPASLFFDRTSSGGSVPFILERTCLLSTEMTDWLDDNTIVTLAVVVTSTPCDPLPRENYTFLVVILWI